MTCRVLCQIMTRTDSGSNQSFKPHDVAKAAGWLAAAQALMMTFKLALVPLLTRLLTPADFGVVTACLAVTAFVTLVGGSGGWASALIVYNRDSKNAWRSGYSATLICAMLFSMALCFFSGSLAALMGLPEARDVLRAMAFLVPLLIASEFLSNYLLSQNKYRATSQIGLIAELTASLCAIAGAFWGLGAWALVLQQFVGAGLRVLLYTLVSRLAPTLLVNTALIKPLIPYTLKATSAEIVNFFGVQYPSLLIAGKLGAGSAGLYGVANRLASMPSDVVMASLSRILVPAIAGIDTSGERSRAVLWSGTANSIVLVPLLFGAAALAQPLCAIVLGPKFEDAAEIFAALCIGKALITPCAGYYAFLKATDRTGTLFFLMTVRSVMMVAATIIGIHFYGLLGAAVGIAIANLPVLLLYCFVVFRAINIKWWDGLASFNTIFLGSLFMVASILGTTYYLEGMSLGNLAHLFAGVFIGAAVYTAFIALTFRKQLIHLINKFRPVRTLSK